MDRLAERLKNLSPLQRAVLALKETQARLETLERQYAEPIAVVGMACRFPGGALDPQSYWRMLCAGVDAIRETPLDRWDADRFYDPDPTVPGKMCSRWGGYLDRIDAFDNHFFGISDREAVRIDPQHRLLLELTWEALEDAGTPPSSLRGTKTGVFVGISVSEYGIMMSHDVGQTDSHAAAGTSLCLAPNRVSFVFGLQGPSVAMDTACSSSLVAIHMACQSMRNGECEMALAGGTNLLLSPLGTINLTKAGFCAPDGRVRAFDAAASGYVRSEGAGIVVLKSLTAALKNRDPIYAVIRGSAVNQNGASNGLTAPSRAAQEQVLREAYARARVSPGQIQYVETQGTGTRLGDTIEALALGDVLNEGRAAGCRCAIGSVKTNIGHLETASGVASLMKAALALKHRQLPPSLHFREPNPDIPFDHLPLRVLQKLEPWPESGEPRLAGVSAFGFGGSNAHVVLEEPPPAEDSAADSAQGACLLPLSARTANALHEMARVYVEFLGDAPPPWRDVCYTAAVRRDHHDCRLAVLAETTAEARGLLKAFLDGKPQPGVFSGRKPYGRSLKTAFVYGEHAGAWESYGAGLARSLPDFESALADNDDTTERTLGWRLSLAFKEDKLGGVRRHAPSALLALQMALTAWWRAVGVTPDVVVGAGVGEVAAAWAAGILTSEEALRLVAGSERDGTVPPQSRAALLPFLSSVDGRAHSGPDLGADHWQSCLRQPPKWDSVAAALSQRTVDFRLGLGPDTPSGTLSRCEAWEPTAATVGRLYAAGVDVKWGPLTAAGGRCVRLPAYPWQKQRHWAPRNQWNAPSPAAMETNAPPDRCPRPDLNTPYVAPQAELEMELAEIWEEILQVERVGIHDNFFALGGHSLLAAQVASRIASRVHADLPLREMFQAPTIAELVERIESATAGNVRALGPPIVPVPRSGEMLPSFTQEALWFLDQLERGRATYTIYSPLRIRGPLSVITAERAIQEIMRRHESLRTRFPEVDGRPIQVIEPAVPHPLAQVDLSRLPEAQRERRLRDWIAEEMRRPIDLQNGPLIRITMLKLSEDDHVAMVSAHHMIYDGWSMAVLLRELATLYVAFETGQPSPLPELPVQYADFVAWQRQWLKGERLERLRGYWVGQLAGTAPVELPLDHPRPSIRTTRGASRMFDLATETCQALLKFCRQEGVTPFIALLAVFKVLLQRHSGQDDITVGSPVANRTRPETAALIGYFVNVVVLRNDMSGDPSFREVLQRVRQVTLDAYDHQDMTLDQVVAAVNPPRDMSRHPLFQVMFALHNIELPQLDTFGLRMSALENGPGAPASYFDLTLAFWQTGTAFRGEWNFSTDLFQAETIDRMARHYEILLTAAIAQPDRSLSSLPLLAEEERQQVVIEWNRTAVDYPREMCIHELFASRAEQTPDTVAVVLDEERWTYRQLNERANQLARFLQRRGVSSETRVGVCLERSPQLLLAVLGTLKAGGAYVPLDPVYIRAAEERLQYVLQDAQVSLLLTSSDLAASLSSVYPNVLALDGETARGITSENSKNLDASTGAENLAYLLYTSGSTGRPKGVMVTHRNLVNAYHGWRQAYRLETDVRSHLQMASFGFDVFGGDMVRALGSGGKLVICPRETLLDPAQLVRLIRREKIDIGEFVPVVMRYLVQYLEDTDQTLDSLRLAIVGSDAWYVAEHKRTLRRLGPNTRLINSYGLTETTIDSSYFEGDAGLLPDAALVPIGRPLANVRLYVLDGQMQPAPIGVPGEVYIGGDGVSRGYVNAELDAERFLEDPFSPASKTRLCRTGDRARWRVDGQLEFLGRADNQVKIRGFRIEPGEIEEVLGGHPGLTQAAVAARERAAGDLRLVAYVVGKAGAVPEVIEMKQFVARRLPDYMVPTAFVALDALPTTASGKVDRKALPAPDWTSMQAQGEFVAPRVGVEQQLAAIWSEVLKLDRVGAHDNFFDLGGNSLLAMRLAARISASFARRVAVRDLFIHQTVAEQAELVSLTAASVGVSKEATPAGMHRETGAARYRAPARVTVEREPLEDLIRTGRIEPVDSAALGYWSEWYREQMPIVPDLLQRGLLARRPLLSDVRQTPWGRIAMIVLPMFESELYMEPEQLVRHAVEGIEFAGSLGARVVSLTGLIPSATDNGRALVDALGNRPDLPRPTTGHATTATTVVLSLRRALGEAGRALCDECVAFVGLGSVGHATLRSMIDSLPYPREIILCDLFRKMDGLRKIQSELVEELGFRGNIRLLFSAGKVPEELYEATTIVGATNVPNVLEVDRIRPGTIVVDDSAPHSFGVLAAIERFETTADILFTEGGILKLPEPIRQFRYLPPGIETFLTAGALETLLYFDPLQLTGCVLSGLLSARFDDVPPTIGEIDTKSLEKNFEKLAELGLEGADLHCEGYLVSPENIPRFRRRFGTENRGELDALRQARHEVRKPATPLLASSLDQARSLVTLRPGGPATPLFCIHGLGGHIAALLPLARGLDYGRPVYGLQAVGLDPGQEPHDRIEPMAALYLKEIQDLQRDGPYLLVGWSMGGLIALEMAQQLLVAGQTVALVAMLDTYLSLKDFPPDSSDQSVLGRIVSQLGIPVAELKDVPLQQQWDRIAVAAENADGIGIAEIRRLAAACKAHLRALASYEPRPYTGRCVLFPAENSRSGRDRGWAELCPQLCIEPAAGDHFSMLREPHVQTLAERLGRYLQESDGDQRMAKP